MCLYIEIHGIVRFVDIGRIINRGPGGSMS